MSTKVQHVSDLSRLRTGKLDRNGHRSDRVRQILDAAVVSFAKRGFYHTRISDIARRAGIADGTIYIYFRSKDDILISIFEVRMQELLDKVCTGFALCTTPSEKLGAFIEMYGSLVVEDPALAEVITIELRQSNKFIREYANPKFKELLHLLAEVIASGQQSGVFRKEIDARIAARALFGALDEISLQGVLSHKGLNVAKAVQTLTAIFLGGMEIKV